MYPQTESVHHACRPSTLSVAVAVSDRLCTQFGIILSNENLLASGRPEGPFFSLQDGFIARFTLISSALSLVSNFWPFLVWICRHGSVNRALDEVIYVVSDEHAAAVKRRGHERRQMVTKRTNGHVLNVVRGGASYTSTHEGGIHMSAAGVTSAARASTAAPRGVQATTHSGCFDPFSFSPSVTPSVTPSTTPRDHPAEKDGAGATTCVDSCVPAYSSAIGQTPTAGGGLYPEWRSPQGVMLSWLGRQEAEIPSSRNDSLRSEDSELGNHRAEEVARHTPRRRSTRL